MQNKCIHCRLPGAVFGTAAVQHAARRCSAAAAQQLVAVLACQTCQPACYKLPVRDLYCFRQFKKTLHLVRNASARTGTSQTCLVDRQAEARPSKQMAVETLARHCLPIKNYSCNTSLRYISGCWNTLQPVSVCCAFRRCTSLTQLRHTHRPAGKTPSTSNKKRTYCQSCSHVSGKQSTDSRKRQ